MGDSSLPQPQASLPLPTASLISINHNISLLPPLTRKGHGPGLILVLPVGAPQYPEGGSKCIDGIPPPLLKWAEEGFAVVEIRHDASDIGGSGEVEREAVAQAMKALEACEGCDVEEGVGMICESLLVCFMCLCRVARG